MTSTIKNKIVFIRVSEEERHILDEAARNSFLKTTQFIRQAALVAAETIKDQQKNPKTEVK